MATIDLTKDTFEEVVTGNDVVLVDFWAPWCGPCKGFAPVYEAASEKHPDVVFAKVNTDEEQELAGHFSIRSIPTIALFREKVMLFSQAGALPAGGLESVIEQAKALDMAKVHEEIEAAQKEHAAQEAQAQQAEQAAQTEQKA
jgi:thioredoxin 1